MDVISKENHIVFLARSSRSAPRQREGKYTNSFVRREKSERRFRGEERRTQTEIPCRRLFPGSSIVLVTSQLVRRNEIHLRYEMGAR